MEIENQENKVTEENVAEEQLPDHPVLTVDDILNFEPPVEYKGYSPMEVDKFLDKVIGDYDIYNDQLEKARALADQKQNEIGELKKQVADLKEQVAVLQDQLNTAENAHKNDDADTTLPGSGTQVDMLKRIARLEKAVFGSKDL